MSTYLSKADQACFSCKLKKCNDSAVDCARARLAKDKDNLKDRFGLSRNAGPFSGDTAKDYSDGRERPDDADTRYVLCLPHPVMAY
mgnify:CR=1 FL=1